MRGFSIIPLAAVLAAALAASGCGGGGVVTAGGSTAAPDSVTFIVRDGAGFPVVAATVYLVPAGDVDDSPISGQDVRSGDAENRDEPLEDAVRLRGAGYPSGITDGSGRAEVGPVPLGAYFWLVLPGAGDTEHLPGGTGCRIAREATLFLGTTVEIAVSSQPSMAATYVGTTRCIPCHGDLVASHSQHAHRLGFAVPGGPFTVLQNPVRYPEFTQGWDMFLPGTLPSQGTAVWFYDFDPSRSFDKFKTSMTQPTLPGQTIYVRAWLWRDTADGKFKITLENIINGADPSRTYTVELTYGGAVYKQRNLVAVAGRKGLYPLLQFQTEGVDFRWSRTRRVFRDYHLDWFFEVGPNTFRDPAPGKAFEGNCTGCHSTGFARIFDAGTQEWLSEAVEDPFGAYNLDGLGLPEEVNLGCEVCHGPGSEHEAWASNPANVGSEWRYIVSLEALSPSREMMICGRCHDRQVGAGPVATEEPLNAQGLMARPGTSRAEHLASYVAVNGKGPAPDALWGDDLFSKSHHQQYSDLLKSRMHRNDRILTTCSDCHDSHGNGPFEHHTRFDPNLSNSYLCVRCHAIEPFAHMLAKTGSTHAGNQTTCVKCHMAKTAKTGAGHYGILLGTPVGTMADESITYWENDLSTHLFLGPPPPSHPSVAGVLPENAMPIPYTNSCGSPCHNISPLQSMDLRMLSMPPAAPEPDEYLPSGR